jgi:outer membrane protein TolC
MASQISSIELRLKDDVAKQQSQRKAIEATIASIDSAVISTQQAVVTPLTEYVEKMQRAYTAGAVTIIAYLDAQRSLHDAERKLIAMKDQRDQSVLQLIEKGGMLPGQLNITPKQSDRK